MGQLGIRIANVALFTVCCFQVASVVNHVSADFLMPGPASFAASAVPAARGPRDWDERKAILDRNLFGAQIFAGDFFPEPEPQEDLEETRLPVQLLGTQLSSIREHSKAAIADRGARNTELLHEGDSLEKHPQARLIRIERGRVILDNKGRREELLLAEATNLPAARSKPNRSSRRRSRRSASRSVETTPLAERLQELQKARGGGRDMATIFSQGRLVPKYEDGQLVGMELQELEAGSLYEKVGLQEGDVITAVNGIQLDNAAAASKVLPELASAEELNIETTSGTLTVTQDQLSEILAGSAEEEGE
jgi:general secretion pathway protein C